MPWEQALRERAPASRQQPLHREPQEVKTGPGIPERRERRGRTETSQRALRPPSLRAGLADGARFQRRGRPQDLYKGARPPGGTEAPQGTHTGLRARGPSRVTRTGIRALLLTQDLTSSWPQPPTADRRQPGHTVTVREGGPQGPLSKSQDAQNSQSLRAASSWGALPLRQNRQGGSRPPVRTPRAEESASVSCL